MNVAELTPSLSQNLPPVGEKVSLEHQLALIDAKTYLQQRLALVDNKLSHEQQLDLVDASMQKGLAKLDDKSSSQQQQPGLVEKETTGDDESKQEQATKLHIANVAGEKAYHVLKYFNEHSNLDRRTRRRRKVASLLWSDLKTGQLLGEGSFSRVYETKLVREDPIVDDSITIITDSRSIRSDVWKLKPFHESGKDLDVWDLLSAADGVNDDVSSHDDDEGPPEHFEDEKGTTYALKLLRPSVTNCEKSFTASAIDLVLEAKLLAALKHDNIIKLRAIAEGSIASAFCGTGFFLLLDRL